MGPQEKAPVTKHAQLSALHGRDMCRWRIDLAEGRSQGGVRQRAGGGKGEREDLTQPTGWIPTCCGAERRDTGKRQRQFHMKFSV